MSITSGIRLFDRLISIVSISFRFANIDANAYASIAAPFTTIAGIKSIKTKSLLSYEKHAA